MGRWGNETMGRRVNGMMNIMLKARRKYFKFTDFETNFINAMKNLHHYLNYW